MKRAPLSIAALVALGVLTALLLSASGALGAPPKLDIPPEVTPVQGYARISPKTDAVSVTYIALDGHKLYPFPSDELKDSRRFVLPTVGVKAGKYRYAAVGASKTGEQATVEFTVVVGDVPPEPAPEPKPKPQPEPGPAPVKADAVFVVVVEDAAGARTIETAQALNDNWWATLKPKHDYRHYFSDSVAAKDNGYVKEAGAVGYPAVLVMDAKDGAVLKKFKLNGLDPVKQAVAEVSK